MSSKQYKSISDVFDDTEKMEEILAGVIAEGSDDLLEQIPSYGPDGKPLNPQKKNRTK
jgi:hypothetical protein